MDMSGWVSLGIKPVFALCKECGRKGALHPEKKQCIDCFEVFWDVSNE